MPGGSLFAHRDFRLLLLGQTAGQLGAQVSAVALPLLAVLTLGATPWEAGLVNASSTLAFALIALPAGAWLDRMRRRPVLVASDLLRALLLLGIPVAGALDVLSIPLLVVVSLLSGFARVFFEVGYQSYVPSVVGRQSLISGNSSMETIRASGEVVGPGLGGWLVTLVGAANVVGIQAVTFAVSALSLLGVRSSEPAPLPHPGVGLRAQIAAGVGFVRHNRVLRAVVLVSAVNNFAFAVASAVTFIFLSRTLGLAPAVIGLTVTAGSLGGMLGAALTPRLARRAGSARIIWLSLAVTGPLTLLGPLARPGWAMLLFVFSAAAGNAGQIVYSVTNVSLRQRLCPAHLLGRVTATVRFLILGVFPLGALLGGLLGEVIGVRGTLWLSAAIIAASPLPLYRVLRGTREVEDLPGWDRS